MEEMLKMHLYPQKSKHDCQKTAKHELKKKTSGGKMKRQQCIYYSEVCLIVGWCQCLKVLVAFLSVLFQMWILEEVENSREQMLTASMATLLSSVFVYLWGYTTKQYSILYIGVKKTCAHKQVHVW